MKQKVIIESICFVLIMLFVYAAFSKLFEYNTFKIQLQDSPIVRPIASIVVWLIPTTELVVAGLLTIKYYRKTGLYFSFFLLLIFTLYISSMLLSGIHLPCSCGGIIENLTWEQHLLFNLFFLVLALVGIVLGRNQKFDPRCLKTV